MEDKVDVIRCRDCMKATSGTIEGLLVCTARSGVGCFMVKEDGYCHLAIKRDICGNCKHFEYYEHMNINGARFDGICRGSGDFINSANLFDRKDCEAFEPKETKGSDGN